MTIQEQRDDSSKRRRPPVKGCIVGREDYELLKMIHMTVACGEDFKVPAKNNIVMYHHAYALYKYFDFPADKIFEMTGFIIDEKESTNG